MIPQSPVLHTKKFPSMAYIPPHKRHHSKDGDRSTPTPSPIPASLTPRFKETLNLRPSRRRKDRHGAGKIVYAADAVFRWWPVGAGSGGDPIPASFRLEPFDCEIVERREGEKPLVLVGDLEESADAVAEGQDIILPPWVSIAERVVPDLIAAALGARNELELDGDEEVKLSFVARPGKNIFLGGSSVSLDSIRKAASTLPNSSNKLRKIFYINVPNAYMENVQTSVAPKIGLTFHSEKEHYHIKVSDKCRSDLTITCKCMVTESRQLEIYKMSGAGEGDPPRKSKSIFSYCRRGKPHQKTQRPATEGATTSARPAAVSSPPTGPTQAQQSPDPGSTILFYPYPQYSQLP